MTLSKLKQEGREEFEKEFLEFSYCGDRECEYDGEGKCFHGTEIEMKVFLTAQIEKAYSAGQNKAGARQFGKSTLVNNAFIVAAKTNQSAKYEHPDYVCFTRKAWKEQQEAANKAYLSALSDVEKGLPPELRGSGNAEEQLTGFGRVMGFNQALSAVKEVIKSLREKHES